MLAPISQIIEVNVGLNSLLGKAVVFPPSPKRRADRNYQGDDLGDLVVGNRDNGVSGRGKDLINESEDEDRTIVSIFGFMVLYPPFFCPAVP